MEAKLEFRESLHFIGWKGHTITSVVFHLA